MSIPHSDPYIDHLKGAFLHTFKTVLAEDRNEDIRDFGASWAELTAKCLDDVRLTAAPGIDIDSPVLPFIEIHRLKSELYTVARSGMRGGPTVDVLLQIWFDTEEMLAGYGMPLVFCKVAKTGRLPDALWGDIRETCRHINMATPSGRLVFVAPEKKYSFGSEYFEEYSTISAIDMNSFSGTRLPPEPLRGRRLDALCQDIASGWFGDPALSGLHPSSLLDEFMKTCRIENLLRIKITRDSPTPI